jgi:uncharacterized protein (TIGR00255 family)
MDSMTGFGKAESTTKAGKFTVEISSVNNRYLEISARLPRQYSLLEHKLRDLISARLTRGKISVYVGFEESDTAPGKFLINRAAAKKYARQLGQMKKELRLSGDVTVHELLMLPEVIEPEPETVDGNLVWKGAKKAAEKALVQMVAMRRREGLAMARDMKKRLKTISGLINEIRKDSSLVMEKYRKKLAARIEELLQTKVVDRERLEQEVAILAERCDITEECTRFLSHIDQYTRSVNTREPVGKRLNFILQEMNRETNTIGAKSFETKISTSVIALKEEIEKLRELAQNVE